MTHFPPITPGTHPLFRGLMSPPLDALTTEGYDMTFGTSVLGWLIHVVPRSGNTDFLNCRTLLLHGITHPCATQSIHPRTQVAGCQPLLTNGNHRRLGLWFWARFLNFQGLPGEEKDVRLRIVWSKQICQWIQRLTISFKLTRTRRRRGTPFTLRSLFDDMAIGSPLSRFTQVRDPR